MVGPYRRGRMKRVTLASALTIAGVLSAGAAAALVNTRVLESAAEKRRGAEVKKAEAAERKKRKAARKPPKGTKSRKFWRR